MEVLTYYKLFHFSALGGNTTFVNHGCIKNVYDYVYIYNMYKILITLYK